VLAAGDVDATRGRARSVVREHRRDELGDAAVAAVGEDATMLLAERLDGVEPR